MTIRVKGDRVILSGTCPVEDAEPLLLALQGGAREVDWSGVGRLHTAIVQLLLAAGVPVAGEPADPFARTCLVPLFRSPFAASPVGNGNDAIQGGRIGSVSGPCSE